MQNLQEAEVCFMNKWKLLWVFFNVFFWFFVFTPGFLFQKLVLFILRKWDFKNAPEYSSIQR